MKKGITMGKFVKCIDDIFATSYLKNGKTYEVEQEGTTRAELRRSVAGISYILKGIPHHWWSISRFEIVKENTQSTIIDWAKDVVKSATNECPCGINRDVCSYHN
jgi:hypothetical protein